ncbi:citryl-CoA lyase [Natronomonas marina]|uniref:citryl-CoA lyase n=1 Tax=Natronomonas marina TaxID=2961939 RepID=UPI0020C9C0BD|nr:citryl-CoA lyase [Natronomonas marina]
MADSDAAAWRTAISEARPDEIVYRGYQLTDVVEQLDFASTAFLLARGDPPTTAEARVFNALLAATADHGISPSQAVTRYVSASGSPIQACVAAGVLTIGDHHGGAGEIAASLFEDHLDARNDEPMDEVAAGLIADRQASGDRVPGFGHPEHTDGDPRAQVLVDIAREEGLDGEALALALAVERELVESVGAGLKLNINGVTAALMLDLGFDPSFARPLVIMARVPGLIVHAIEERDRERVWRMVGGGVEYDGPEDRSLEER